VEAPTAAPSRSIEVARIDYTGNCDPEPGAWPRLARLAAARFKTDVKLATVKCDALDPKHFPLAHLTGTTHVTFTDDQIAALKKYVDDGGLLFIDVAGGGPEFADSCTDLIKKISPDKPLEALAPDSPIVTGSMPDGEKIDSVEMRKFSNAKLQRHVTSPELQAVTVNGRLRILYSPWDICSGFLGTNTWGVVGYAPATSEALGRNIVLYAAGK
jgi:hypothetical protein